MELAEHQILISAAREEAYNRGYRDGLTVRDAAFELVQRESFVMASPCSFGTHLMMRGITIAATEPIFSAKEKDGCNAFLRQFPRNARMVCLYHGTARCSIFFFETKLTHYRRIV